MTRKDNTSTIEEAFNIATHGLGLFLSILGLLLLLNHAGRNFSLERMIGFSVFGATIIVSYTVSTLYHSLIFTKARKILKILDHSSVFLLIAGTYTPFLLIALKGKLSTDLLLLIWIFAILGIIMKTFYIHKFKKISLIFYLFMGWFIVFGIKPLLMSLPIQIVGLTVLGGLSYTFGVGFYIWKKLPFNHVIWHIFVLGGSLCHFFAMFYL